MSFLPLVYVGDFEREGPCVRLASTPDEPILKPVVRCPIDPTTIEQLVSGFPGSAESGAIPSAWQIWPEDRYLVCDRYALGVEEILFLKRLVGETNCRLFERSFEISVDDLTPKRQVANPAEIPSSQTADA